MKKLLVSATTLVGLLVLSTSAGAPAAGGGKPLKVRGGIVHLVARGDRLYAGYTLYSGSKAVRGTLYARSDRQRAFARLPLTRSNGYRARVATRLLRGKQLFYYAVFRDPKGGRSLTLPAAGARAPAIAWILDNAVKIRLGTHRFGQTRTPEAVVARARADEVGWDINEEQGFHLGPQTLQVGADRSVWLEDSFNNRLLVWNAGHPDGIARAVPVPWGAGMSDVAFGRDGGVYVTRKLLDPLRFVLDKLSATTGRLLWERRIGRDYGGGPSGSSYPVIGNGSSLRVGPDGTIYYLVGMGLPGGEWGWMPVATPGGSPLAPWVQLGRIDWPLQPPAGGLRLLGPEFYTPHEDTAPHEVRYALVNRRGRLVRAWRIFSRTEFNFIHRFTPELVGGEPVVALDFLESDGPRQSWEYEVLRLGRRGARAHFSLSREIWGEGAPDDLRLGPDGKLYKLATSPESGIVISRYSLR
jgi:hypothetical protein